MSKYNYFFFFVQAEIVSTSNYMWKSELLPLQESGENLKLSSFGCFLQAKRLLQDYLSIIQKVLHRYRHTLLFHLICF